MSGSVSRTYENDFRITSRSVNGAHTISFGYDADSLLTSAGSESLTYDSANGLLGKDQDAAAGTSKISIL